MNERTRAFLYNRDSGDSQMVYLTEEQVRLLAWLYNTDWLRESTVYDIFTDENVPAP